MQSVLVSVVLLFNLVAGASYPVILTPTFKRQRSGFNTFQLRQLTCSFSEDDDQNFKSPFFSEDENDQENIPPTSSDVSDVIPPPRFSPFEPDVPQDDDSFLIGNLIKDPLVESSSVPELSLSQIPRYKPRRNQISSATSSFITCSLKMDVDHFELIRQQKNSKK